VLTTPTLAVTPPPPQSVVATLTTTTSRRPAPPDPPLISTIRDSSVRARHARLGWDCGSRLGRYVWTDARSVPAVRTCSLSEIRIERTVMRRAQNLEEHRGLRPHTDLFRGLRL
jgi:hypothetical protein